MFVLNHSLPKSEALEPQIYISKWVGKVVGAWMCLENDVQAGVS